jgi:hypothetical protein
MLRFLGNLKGFLPDTLIMEARKAFSPAEALEDFLLFIMESWQ